MSVRTCQRVTNKIIIKQNIDDILTSHPLVSLKKSDFNHVKMLISCVGDALIDFKLERYHKVILSICFFETFDFIKTRQYIKRIKKLLSDDQRLLVGVYEDETLSQDKINIFMIE